MKDKLFTTRNTLLKSKLEPLEFNKPYQLSKAPLIKPVDIPKEDMLQEVKPKDTLPEAKPNTFKAETLNMFKVATLNTSKEETSFTELQALSNQLDTKLKLTNMPLKDIRLPILVDKELPTLLEDKELDILLKLTSLEVQELEEPDKRPAT